MSDPGHSLLVYVYSMPQGNSAAKRYPADDWSWIQLLLLCLLLSQGNSAATSYPADEWSWIQLLFLCLFNIPR